MSESIKPTPGPWTVAGENAVEPDVMWGECFVAQCFGFSDPDEALANAILIAEAGTVFHTTGMTPMQLVERVKELEHALKGCAAVCAGKTMSKNGLVLALENARAALAKCQGEKE